MRGAPRAGSAIHADGACTRCLGTCSGTTLTPANVQTLPPDRLIEVDDFVDFGRLREQEWDLTRDATTASAAACFAIWSNPEDSAYDVL